MNGVRYEDLPDDNPNKHPGVLSKLDVCNYCIDDVRYTYELLEKLPPMSSMEDEIAEHTRLINRRGVYIDRAMVEHDKELLEVMKFEAFRAIPWHNTDKPLSYAALKRWGEREGVAIPKSRDKKDEECMEMMSADPRLNAVLGAMRRHSKANTLIEKINVLNMRLTEGDVLPLDLMYCGAPHTRRWSSKNFNIQNLDKKPTVVTNDGGTIWTRNWVVPPPGKMFLVLDYSQVEPRVLNWLVGNEEMMDALRKGFSYYEAYATFARGWKGAPGTIKKEYGVQKYTLLKNECLGLGYGMGIDRFISYAAENGATITSADAKPVVYGFRERNKKIVDFWGKLDNLIISASRDKQKELAMVMPSGDLLKYFSIRMKKGGGYEGYTVKGDFSGHNKQFNLWGGTLTENVTQRAARDILAEAVVRLEAAGFPVQFHTHDEVILAVEATDDEQRRAEIKAEASRIMREPPAWCAGLPLDVDGEFCDRYTKM